MRTHHHEITVRYYCSKCKGERRGVGRTIFAKKGTFFTTKISLVLINNIFNLTMHQASCKNLMIQVNEIHLLHLKS